MVRLDERQAENRLRRDVDRWLGDGMTADQYDAFREHVAAIRAVAQVPAEEERLDVDRLARALAATATARLDTEEGLLDAYHEEAALVAAEYRALGVESSPVEDPTA